MNGFIDNKIYENINITNFIHINDSNINEYEEYKSVIENKKFDIFIYKNNPDFLLIKEKVNKNEWNNKYDFFMNYLINDNVYSIINRTELLNYSNDLCVDIRDNIYLNYYLLLKNKLLNYSDFNDINLKKILNKTNNIILNDYVHIHYIPRIWNNKYVLFNEIKDDINIESIIEYNDEHLKNNINDKCCIPYVYILNLEDKDIINIKAIFWVSKKCYKNIYNYKNYNLSITLFYDKNNIEYICLGVEKKGDGYYYFIIEDNEDKKYILDTYKIR
jgi:hypothetical protein